MCSQSYSLVESTTTYSVCILYMVTIFIPQDVPAHVVTPTKQSVSAQSTPQQPLSSSAPSYYGNETTPPGLMDTPVEMLLSAHRLKNENGNCFCMLFFVHHFLYPIDYAQLPLHAQVQRRMAVGGSSGKREGGSGVKVHKTGRTPYITRLQTPHNGMGTMAKVCSCTYQ